jgi:ankyrin repeat protein
MDKEKLLGKSIIELSISESNIKDIQHLISIGADVNYYDEMHDLTALHRAVFYGNKEVIKLLIEHKVDISSTDVLNRTAWDIASEEIRKEIPELRPKMTINPERI